MKKTNVFSLPTAKNVCNQMLREIWKSEKLSIAHVVMNPAETTILHQHSKMTEAYVITKGCGDMCIGNGIITVRSGNVIGIPPKTPHKLTNISMTSLEYFALASPAFDPNDVEQCDDKLHGYYRALEGLAPLAKLVECFDGAKIRAYALLGFDASVAFGSVIADPARRKECHYHKEQIEFVCVVEGIGQIEVGGEIIPTDRGDWLTISPGESHAFRNYRQEHMAVVCISTPRFDIADVYYRK